MSRNNLLVVTPRKPRCSQEWLRQHAMAMREDLAATATYEAAGESWIDGVPNIEVGHRLAAGRYGLGKLLRIRSNVKASHLADADLTGAVVHFAHLYDLLSPPNGPIAELPTAVYVHGIDITWSPLKRFPIPYKHLANTRSYQKRLIEYAERVVYLANSDHSRTRLIAAGLPEHRVRTCYLPVERRVDVQRVERPSGRVDLVYLGRLIGCKGPMDVVRAVKLARQAGADVRLTIIGDGHLREPTGRLVDELSLSGSVQMLGALSNDAAMRHLAASDALILHNQTDNRTGQIEAFGYAHAEALVHGVPVLTGASGGPTEFLVDGHNALLVEPGDVAHQAEQILKLAYDDSLHQNLVDGAMESGARLFSSEAHRATVLSAIRGAS